MTIAGSLVWLRGQRGPIAEKWPVGTTATQRAENRDRVLAEHELEAREYSMRIAILEQRYPAPKPPEERAPVIAAPAQDECA